MLITIFHTVRPESLIKKVEHLKKRQMEKSVEVKNTKLKSNKNRKKKKKVKL